VSTRLSRGESMTQTTWVICSSAAKVSETRLVYALDEADAKRRVVALDEGTCLTRHPVEITEVKEVKP